jgi:VacB/RNase II family 3'-5' exoribonuclease
MLNSDALNQLSQLKQDIRASKDFAEGIIRGTKGRYGFVVLDDGREAFLDPDQMQRVFPGDRVEVSVTKNEKDQFEATLEKLIATELKEFVGSYLQKGKGHFVVPDVPFFNRWVFIAPKHRKNAKDGDFLRASITRHPFEDGKGQAKVLAVIGTPKDAFIERSYIINKFQRQDQFAPALIDAATAIAETPLSEEPQRQDLTELPLVTIDSESTVDMDDALFAETTATGWRLVAAIADPTSGIDADSTLFKDAELRGQTLYFPGKSAPMMPPALAHETYSLLAKQQRPALCVELAINKTGSVESCQFMLATIESKAKLSYDAVSELIDTGTAQVEIEPEIQQSLLALKAMADARLDYRKQNALVMEERPDYDYQVNETGKIVEILRHDRNSAQKIVEEAMLACNQSAGKYFAENNLPALFSTHLGFREDRVQQVQNLIKEALGDLPETLNELHTYRDLINRLQTQPELARFLSALKRQLSPSQLSTEEKPHLGLGFEQYANITSPIRRFNDLYNHLLIKSQLTGDAFKPIDETRLEQLRETISQGRSASRQLEQWLVCQYAQSLIGQEVDAQIAMVNSQGIGARVAASGVETFVQLRDRKNKEQKIEFSPEKLLLTVDGREFVLDTPIKIKITSVDLEQRQVIAALA